jgi:hypothetical protein
LEALEDRTLPSFSAPILSTSGTGPYGIAVADLNGDGHDDVVTVNASSNSVSILYGNGDGTFKTPVNSPVGSNPQHIAIGSLRNNGLLDLVVTSYVQSNNNDLTILLNNGDGTFTNGGTINNEFQARSVALADLNNDGNLDLIVPGYDFTIGSSGPYVDVRMGNGDGTFGPATRLTSNDWGAIGPVDVTVADFDGDAKLDIIAANGGYSAAFFKGNGDGTFQKGVGFPTDHRNLGIIAADLRGNGVLDLISAGDTYGWVSIMRGNGNGTFQTPQRIGFAGSTSVVAADFRGTGKPDLAVINETGNETGDSLQLLLNDGSGNFSDTNTQTYAIATGPGAQAHYLAVGDFNEDGRPDLVVGLTAFNKVSVLLNRPDVTKLDVSAADTTVAGDVLSMTVTAESKDGSTNPYYTGHVHFTSTDTSAVLPSDYTFTEADAGVHTFNISLRKAGSQKVTIADTSNSALTASSTTDVSAAAASNFGVSGFPSPVRAGTVNTFTVTARDAFGNLATDYVGTVTFTCTDAKAILPDDYDFTAADNGTHVFAAVLKTTGLQTLTAADTLAADLKGSQAITITPGLAKLFIVKDFPSPVVAGSVHTFSVITLDAYDNIVTDYGGTVHFTSTDSQAILPVDYTFTAADKGTRVFGAVLYTAGTQSITATQLFASVTGTQSGIVVTPGAASRLVLTAALTQVNADQDFELTLTVYDAYGNIATGYLGTVDFSSSDSGAEMPLSYTFSADDAGVRVLTCQLHQLGLDTITVVDQLKTDLTGSMSILVI